MQIPSITQMAMWASLLAGTASIAIEPAHPDDILAATPPCSIRVTGQQVTLVSPHFVMTLDTADTLRAVSWQNRLTERTLQLGNGPEVEFDIGLPGELLITPTLHVTSTPTASTGERGDATFELAADAPPLSVTVRYRWDAQQPVLRKSVTITNQSRHPWNRLLNIRLGDYVTDASGESGDTDYPVFLESRLDDLAGRRRGFPAYVAGQFFVGLAHPAGLALRDDATVTLRQLPGAQLTPGASFECMEAVYGVSREGESRQAFREYLTTRMRRVLRGHDRPLAIFEPFGAKPDGDFWETEDFVIDNVAKVAQGQRDTGLHWDYYSIDFWHDIGGDFQVPDARRFPHGFGRILPELKALGTLPGLWIDSGRLAWWSIGDNPAVAPAITTKGTEAHPMWDIGPTERSICRATAPANQLYIEGFTHQMRHNGVRLLKFDNALLVCSNPAHTHLPGEYSVEPITNALIEFLQALDVECPDVFLMLCWNYQSPWWLHYADTVFDVGMHMEGASFSPRPALRARDSVTRRLDMGRWMLRDWPALGWDTLGIWLSDWAWNSHIGKEAWQSGMIMDICRGHLLAQLWSDTPYLSPDERRDMADLIALLKAQPACFRNPRFILGNPWRDEPYGYCCSDGTRAFLAINNGVWRDSQLILELNSAWGLPDNQRWDLYRWWPCAAKLAAELDATSTLTLRPFEVVLLEAVPTGGSPTLGRSFARLPSASGISEPTRALAIAVETRKPEEEAVAWTVLEPTEFRSTGGATLTKLPDNSLLAEGENPPQDTYVVLTAAPSDMITAIRLETLPDDRLPHQGPGRAVNGNFTLTDFRVVAAGTPVHIARARSGFSQTSHGGWPVAASVDGDPETGWGIHPAEGLRHVAVFELEQPWSPAPNAILEFHLSHAPRQHSIGRLRLSATAAPQPVPVPSSTARFVVSGTLPPTRTGGLLAVSDAFFSQGQPHWSLQCQSAFEVSGTLSGTSVQFEPAINNGMYPAPWQTWRLPILPSGQPRAFEMQIISSLPPQIDHHFAAYFLPAGDQR